MMRARLLGLWSIALVCGCTRQDAADPDVALHVRTLRLPVDEPPMPPGPELNAFQASCVMCHSSRYVTNQPPLSRKKWLAEIEKMRDAYGAPVPPDAVPKIVDYLASVRGDGT
jgi:hypothetical protein